MVYKHQPILVHEIIDLLNINKEPKNKIIVDCTLGLGGHTKEFLTINPLLKIIAIDQDSQALDIAKKNLEKFQDNIEYHNCNFNQIENILKQAPKVDGFLLDLGISSMHLDNPDRGFSFQNEGKLDMRMDQQSNQISAYEVINSFTQEKISTILKKYGEEPFANLIAKNICKWREKAPIVLTSELDTIIKNSIPKKILFKLKNPSTRSFQAIRIYVNNELEVLENTLKIIIEYLKPGGRIAVITFHSLEDRIVKHFFKKLTKSQEPLGIYTKEKDKILSDFRLVNSKAIISSEAEREINSRSKSAKLRILEKARG